MCFKFLNLNFFSVIENGRVILTDDKGHNFQKKTTKHIPPKMQNGIFEVLETVEGLKCWKE
ncbi:hypothetical protein T01_878 [Trichinella spiralis]|uniref:Uncharacterized protein n=1 Tax=Trichinella spiralis TaxID=6334 RepID=A0A0V1AL39_TRISP|nr:hypothetical protein T01_878 [Trichinella spiralis]